LAGEEKGGVDVKEGLQSIKRMGRYRVKIVRIRRNKGLEASISDWGKKERRGSRGKREKLGTFMTSGGKKAKKRRTLTL